MYKDIKMYKFTKIYTYNIYIYNFYGHQVIKYISQLSTFQ